MTTYTAYWSEKPEDRIIRENPTGPTMKVMMRDYELKGIKNCPKTIPMSVLSEVWAKKLHGQSLERLNQRGGLGVSEILANMKNLRLPDKEADQSGVDEMNRIVSASLSSYLMPDMPEHWEGRSDIQEKDFELGYEVFVDGKWVKSGSDEKGRRVIAIPVSEKERGEVVTGMAKYATEQEDAFVRRSLDLFRKTGGNVTVTPTPPSVEAEAKAYQLCPKCNGQGTVSKPPNISGDVIEWTSADTQFECNLCNGKMVIPLSGYAAKEEEAVSMKGEKMDGVRAVVFAEWSAKNTKGFNRNTGQWIYLDHSRGTPIPVSTPVTTSELYTIFKNNK